MKIKSILFCMGILMCFAQNSFAQIKAGTYRLTTEWLGSDKALDMVNDGEKNEKINMADVGDFSGQHWIITPVPAATTGGVGGFYRITNVFGGTGKSLDVVNDGTNDRLRVTKSGHFMGQYWRITPVKECEGCYRLTTQWRGTGFSLEVVSADDNTQLRLTKTGDLTGQYWHLTPIED
jgi:hypothetical protein